MHVVLRLRMSIVSGIVMVVACADAPPAPVATPPDDPSAVLSMRALPRFGTWVADQLEIGSTPSPSTWPVLVGAGDIAECYQPPPPLSLETAQAQARTSPAAATAALLDRIPGTVVTLGDNAYEFGSPFDYEACYEPTWGRHYERTQPAAGNHEYITPGALGYFTYFPDRSDPPLGYYSYDLGGWHVVVLNSTPQAYSCYPPEFTEVMWPGPPQLASEPTSAALGRLCAGDVVQQAWLIKDLSENSDHPCTVAYFHHPRFSSGNHGNQYTMQRIWDILYAYGVDVVLSGHDHEYERFAPQNPDGIRDPAFGIREFVVGTGGASLGSVTERVRNSEVLITGSYGVLALGLGSNGYGWAFIATDGSVGDSGSDPCHPPPPGGATLPFVVQ
jgi:acid phosphatase type 7